MIAKANETMALDGRYYIHGLHGAARNRGAEMAKRYATKYSNGHSVETSSPHEAYNFRNCEDEQKFFLSGKEVSASDFFSAVRESTQRALNKKMETHKRVRVLYGSSAGCYVEKWVRK
jgi:hypothetical protein